VKPKRTCQSGSKGKKLRTIVFLKTLLGGQQAKDRKVKPDQQPEVNSEGRINQEKSKYQGLTFAWISKERKKKGSAKGHDMWYTLLRRSFPVNPHAESQQGSKRLPGGVKGKVRERGLLPPHRLAQKPGEDFLTV